MPGLGAFGNQSTISAISTASQFTTGRFVLLPKNLVTGAAKVRIVVARPARAAFSLWKINYEAPAHSGLFSGRRA